MGAPPWAPPRRRPLCLLDSRAVRSPVPGPAACCYFVPRWGAARPGVRRGFLLVPARRQVGAGRAGQEAAGGRWRVTGGSGQWRRRRAGQCRAVQEAAAGGGGQPPARPGPLPAPPASPRGRCPAAPGRCRGHFPAASTSSGGKRRRAAPAPGLGGGGGGARRAPATGRSGGAALAGPSCVLGGWGKEEEQFLAQRKWRVVARSAAPSAGGPCLLPRCERGEASGPGGSGRGPAPCPRRGGRAARSRSPWQGPAVAADGAPGEGAALALGAGLLRDGAAGRERSGDGGAGAAVLGWRASGRAGSSSE